MPRLFDPEATSPPDLSDIPSRLERLDELRGIAIDMADHATRLVGLIDSTEGNDSEKIRLLANLVGQLAVLVKNVIVDQRIEEALGPYSDEN